VRASTPGVNELANLLRRKSAATPFFTNTIYALSQVMAVLQRQGFREPFVTLASEGDIDLATIIAIRQSVPAPAGRSQETPAESKRPSSFIDVRDLIASAPIEEHNARAERYFSSLNDYTDHLAKPFAHIQDAPQLLIHTGVLLQGLALAPGMTVLEYGAGTGWLSHALTQLGCRSILLDVSATALEIARRLFEDHQPFGTTPEPAFLVFDGHRIDLPDASVDRVICFDAFHHAPNPDEVLREFARVLKPGGLAGFAEPGPQHSLTAQSQHEMRTYGVIESDIHLEEIEREARQAGFEHLRVAGVNVPPFRISLVEYEDLLAGGATLAKWAEVTKSHMRNVRIFYLKKEGTEAIDSRRIEGLHATMTAELTAAPHAGVPIRIRARVKNSGTASWLASGIRPGGVSIGTHLFSGSGALINPDHAWLAIPRTLAPDDEVTFEGDLPPLEAGRYILELDCVSDGVAWFGQLGSPTVRLDVEVTRR
jgi:ubiquinone/menaquinone biosynthesis C-methylase UbiE